MREIRKNQSLGSMLMFAGLAMGFQPGDLMEFRQAYNGHADSDVRAVARNVNFSVATRTQGQVKSFKKLRNGNYAVELVIRSGKHAGRTAWFFYNSKNPAMKLFADDASAQTIPVETPEQARSARTTRETTAVSTDSAKESPSSLSQMLPSVMEAVSGDALLGARSPNCTHEAQVPAPLVEPASEEMPGKYPESDAIAPIGDEHSGSPRSGIVCRTRDEGYEACSDRSGNVHYFGFTFSDVESGDPENRTREWEFTRSEGARQELEMRITDSTDDSLSRDEESYIRFFPRRVLPAIRRDGDTLNVTLPTGEKVQFDAHTKKVLGGVLSEKALLAGVPARVTYNGSGVILRADRRGGDPRTGKRNATISKPACKSGEVCKPCSVPVSKLWTNNADNPQFLFASDDQFDQFVRKTCGFSIY